MTGVADVYLMLRRPKAKESRQRFAAIFQKKKAGLQKFVVLSWKRCGSNLLCGIIHNHPEIIMHNELFNPIDIFTYHPTSLLRSEGPDSRWNYLARDLWPKLFLEQILSGLHPDGSKIKAKGKAVGFKSFPDHWRDARNEDIWNEDILGDHQVKKIILVRECELSVWVSMKRAEKTGSYMTKKYPQDLCIEIDIPAFQAFVNHFKFTFQRKYKSTFHLSDSFHISYEQLTDEEHFDKNIAPLLWKFLGVDDKVTTRRLKEVTKQSHANETIESVISNYEQVEYAFRHSDVLYFVNKRKRNEHRVDKVIRPPNIIGSTPPVANGSWSILLPICSRSALTRMSEGGADSRDGGNRFGRVETLAQYNDDNMEVPTVCWERMEKFAESFINTTTDHDRSHVEFVVGIDDDDKVFNTGDAKVRIKHMLPCKVKFISIPRNIYGKVCKIWNRLAGQANNDFIVLFGDDVVLVDKEWKQHIETRFKEIADSTKLDFGTGCVAFTDISFQGFPTFPVVHRTHLERFDSLLPRQFVNQGGDPYLYELYSRFNASSFVTARLKNTLGGDSDARYLKHDINWKGNVLRVQLDHLKKFLGQGMNGICLDIVVPSFRTQNDDILEAIMKLRASIHVYVKFWIVVDNPDERHVEEVTALATKSNEALTDTNYFVNVVHYGENRGASYARNTGYNYSTADWILFLDDDVVPDCSIIDAYAGSIQRYPKAKIMIGLTELPPAFNTWTQMLRNSNVMYFYGISKHRIHPPWGVTANMLVKGSRHNHPVQFKGVYPKTGGGEDIDFVFQMKEFYGTEGAVVAVKGAKVKHPWWNEGKICYRQIKGWANGDSLCLTEWPKKTFFVAPNWIECILILGFAHVLLSNDPLRNIRPLLHTCVGITAVDHFIKTIGFLTASKSSNYLKSLPYRMYVGLGAGTIISSQEITRVYCAMKRFSLFAFSRRMDWFDGQAPMEVFDYQLRSILHFLIYACIARYFYY